MRALAITVIATLVGCKTDDAKPVAKPPTPSGAEALPSAKDPSAAKASSPAAANAPAVLLDTVLLREPTFRSATPLAPIKIVDERAHQSWCVPGTDALAIASDLATALQAAGWLQVSTRGTADRAATSGDADGVTLAITVGGRDAACTGLVATGVYTTQTITVPPVADGERLR